MKQTALWLGVPVLEPHVGLSLSDLRQVTSPLSFLQTKPTQSSCVAPTDVCATLVAGVLGFNEIACAEPTQGQMVNK